MTSRLRFRVLARLALSWGLLCALCLACTYEEGERATTGSCPEGEICSDATPTGLTFYGPPPSDDEATFLPRLAMRGSQNISYGGADALLSSAVGESSASWFLMVEPADAERDAYAIWTGPDDLRLTAAGEGEAYLRIVDPASGELFDRVLITVEQIDRVDAVGFDGEPLGQLTAGAPVTIVFRLMGDSQLRLIDEAMTIGSDLEFERASWDCIDLDVPADAQEVSFTVDAGHRRWEVTLPVGG